MCRGKGERVSDRFAVRFAGESDELKTAKNKAVVLE